MNGHTIMTDERMALLDSLRKVRRAQLAALTFADQSLLVESDALKRYFDSDFGSDYDRAAEKAIGAAAIRAVYASKTIPQSQKATVARAQSRAAVELMRYGKLDYHYATDRIMAREYSRRMRENSVAQRVAHMQRTRNFIVNNGIKIAISTCATALVHSATATAATATVAGIATAAGATAAAVPVAAGVATFAVMTFGTRLLPKKVREPLEKKFDFLQSRACDIAVDAAQTLAQHTDRIAERVRPVVERARSMAERVGRALGKAKQQAAASLSRTSRKIFSWIGIK